MNQLRCYDGIRIEQLNHNSDALFSTQKVRHDSVERVLSVTEVVAQINHISPSIYSISIIKIAE